MQKFRTMVGQNYEALDFDNILIPFLHLIFLTIKKVSYCNDRKENVAKT